MEADSDVEIVTSIGTKTVEATWRRKPTTEPGRVSDTWGPRKMRRTEERTEKRTEEQTEKREIWRYFRTNHQTYVGMRKENVSAVFESDEDAGGSQQRRVQPKRVIVVDEQRSKTINTGKTFDTEIYDISDSDSDISDSE